MKTKNFYSALLLLILSACWLTAEAQSASYIGLTSSGGTYNHGAIIRFDLSTGRDTVLYSFMGSGDGDFPIGSLAFDAVSHLYYGETQSGGSSSHGTLFSFDPQTGAKNILWSFLGGADGAVPQGNILYDATRRLIYGTTYGGGTYNLGTLFSFDRSLGRDSVLFSYGGLTGSDGSQPYGGLAYDPDNGLYYGTTQHGSTCNGSIFSYDPATGKDTAVWKFTNASDGSTPHGGLYYDSISHLIYGTSLRGGTHGLGTIFSFNPSTGRDSVLWSFGAGTDASAPDGDLTYNASKGLFYGITSDGGSHTRGAIFSFNPITGRDSVLWSFGSGTDGFAPHMGGLLYNPSNGLYYAMTTGGGDSLNAGTIINFNPSTGRDSVLWSFGLGTDGGRPYGSFIQYTVFSACPSITSTTTQIGSTSAFVSSSGGAAPYTYMWNTIPAQHNDTATNLVPGQSYTVFIMDHNGCSDTISVNIATSITTYGENKPIHIFPNPTTGILTIIGTAENQSMELSNCLGQMIDHRTIKSRTDQIDISSFENGVYLLKIFNSDGTMGLQQRILKAN